ncbi:MAG: hypothetical protein JXB05_17230 [Myxococcaceae bacterium]|nr:hypothetical protein [Myxococcaceae bacterium]
MNHPRYFVPHASTPAEPVRPDAAAVVNVVDTFRLEGGYLGEQEWIVGLDAVGQLQAVPATERGLLPASAQAQLAHHEVTSGRCPRRIAAAELFFFAVELVEHPADAEGVNDPVYLYGTLMGPWPGAVLERFPGQLTVTRGAVLAGLAHGASDVFFYAQDPESKTAPRSYHALLPGDRPELLAEGRGLVLAYPAVPPDMQTRNAANDPLVGQILYDVLSQLQEDAREHGGPELLSTMELPVPSRVMAIADLETRGYEVNGDVAILRKQRGGLVGKLAGLLSAEKIKVPPEASPPEFLELARRALGALPGWPNEAERVLRALCRPGSGTSPLGGLTPRISIPNSAGARQPIPPRPPPPPARPSDWMNDFLDAHAHTQGPKPKLTRSRPAIPAIKPRAPAASSASSAPEWLSDFGPSPPPAAPARREPAAAEPAPKKKPDWMSDFE